MNLSYNAVVEYVKNLLPVSKSVVTSDNPKLDAQVVAFLSGNKFYTIASDKHRYWYCFVEEDKIPFVKYVLHSNGVNATKHNSRYFYGHEPVLRIRTARLNKTHAGKQFVDLVMQTENSKLNEDVIQNRINLIKQKVK